MGGFITKQINNGIEEAGKTCNENNLVSNDTWYVVPAEHKNSDPKRKKKKLKVSNTKQHSKKKFSYTKKRKLQLRNYRKTNINQPITCTSRRTGN